MNVYTPHHMSMYQLSVDSHLGGGGVKAHFVDKPNIFHNLGLICIPCFTISLPYLRY